MQFAGDRYLTAIFADGRAPECGANRSKASRTQFTEEREQGYPQFMLKPGKDRSVSKTRKAATLVMPQPSAPCERADSVDSCTVAALDAIAAFASQTPAPPRRVSRFFQVWLPYRSPCRADHSAYFGLASFISPILSAVDADQSKYSRERCQCEIRSGNEISVNGNVENAVRFRLLRSPSSFPFRPTRTLRRRDPFPCICRHLFALS